MVLAFVILALVALWLVTALVVVALCMAAAEGDRQQSGRMRRRRIRRPARIGTGRFVPQRCSRRAAVFRRSVTTPGRASRAILLRRPRTAAGSFLRQNA